MERQRDRKPDVSYDIDGDGVVGEIDYFVGRFFDQGKKNFLTGEERAEAIDQVKNKDFLGKFSFGYAKSGVGKFDSV